MPATGRELDLWSGSNYHGAQSNNHRAQNITGTGDFESIVDGLFAFNTSTRRLQFIDTGSTPNLITVPRMDAGQSETIAAAWTFNRGAATPPFIAGATLPSVGSTATMVGNLNSQYLKGYEPDAAANASTIVVRDGSGRGKFAYPSASDDAANKQYVDDTLTGVTSIFNVRVRATGNISVASAPAANHSSWDGLTLSNGDRILLSLQTAEAENGIYVYNGSGSALTRATDADTSTELKTGSETLVLEGTLWKGSKWRMTTPSPYTMGTTVITFVQSGLSIAVTAGPGLGSNGTELYVKLGTAGSPAGYAYTTGGLVYANSASALAQSAALTGLVQGNGTSAPTAITGTSGKLPKWGGSAPYLGDSLFTESGTTMALAGKLEITFTSASPALDVKSANGGYARVYSGSSLATESAYWMAHDRAAFGYDGSRTAVKVGDYSSANLPVAFDAGSTERMRLSATGSLVVGHTNALSRLNVDLAANSDNGTSLSGAFAITSQASTALALSAGIDTAGAGYAWIQSREHNSSTKRALVLNQNGGNVGIGTTTPAAPFDVPKQALLTGAILATGEDDAEWPFQGAFHNNMLANLTAWQGTFASSVTGGVALSDPSNVYVPVGGRHRGFATLSSTSTGTAIFTWDSIVLDVPSHADFAPFVLLRHTSSTPAITNIKVELKDTSSVWITVFNAAPTWTRNLWRGPYANFTGFPVKGVRVTLSIASSQSNFYVFEMGLWNKNMVPGHGLFGVKNQNNVWVTQHFLNAAALRWKNAASTLGDVLLVDGSSNVIFGDNTGSVFSALIFKTGAGVTRLSINSTGAINVPGLAASRIVTTDGSSNLSTTATLGVGLGGTGTGTTFTQGSVIFAGASGVYAQDNTNLFWDDTNNRLGIGGVTSPQATLQVFGASGRTAYFDASSSGTATTLAANFGLAAASSNSSGLVAQLISTDTGSFTGQVLKLESYRASNSGFDFLRCTADADGTPNNVFRVQGDGVALIKGKKVCYGHSVNLGTSSTTYTVTHGLASRNLVCFVRDTTNGNLSPISARATTDNDCELYFNTAPSAGRFDAVILALP